MIVDVNKLKQMKSYMNEINKTPFENIVWMEDGKEVTPPNKEATIKDWKYTGLNNTDYVFSDCYKNGIVEINIQQKD